MLRAAMPSPPLTPIGGAAVTFRTARTGLAAKTASDGERKCPWRIPTDDLLVLEEAFSVSAGVTFESTACCRDQWRTAVVIEKHSHLQAEKV